MKVISNKNLQKAWLTGKAKKDYPSKKVDVPKKPKPLEKADVSKPVKAKPASDLAQISVLRQLHLAIKTWHNGIESVFPFIDQGAETIKEGLKNVDQSIKAIHIPDPVKPVTELKVYNIERDTGGNMTGFQIKAIRGG